MCVLLTFVISLYFLFSIEMARVSGHEVAPALGQDLARSPTTFDARIDELIMWANRLIEEGQQQRTTAAHKAAHMAAKKVALKATKANAADTTAEHN